tara:strand:+ start:602 stop:1111 length:510 start_codon:yes stop_codon:yes gene_type:complete
MASTYDPKVDIRSVDPGRWLEFDGPKFLGLQRDEATWLKSFMAITLPAEVPREIRAMFETCRGTMIYSWFYYPLATLGLEHCFRMMELAVRLRAEDPDGKRSYKNNLKILFDRQVLSAEERQRWEAGRELRNMACHPNGRFLADPGQALSHLRLSAELIVSLLPFPVSS